VARKIGVVVGAEPVDRGAHRAFDRRGVRAGDIVARRLQAGNIGINTIQRNHETPFGGTKLSGVGRDGGSFGLHAYSELQSVVWPG